MSKRSVARLPSNKPLLFKTLDKPDHELRDFSWAFFKRKMTRIQQMQLRVRDVT